MTHPQSPASPPPEAPSTVAQAPAQAGEVARLLSDAKAALQLINKRSDHYWRKVDRSLDAALARLATQPLAAPVQREAEAVAWQERQQKSATEWTAWYDAKAKTAMGKGPGFSETIDGIEYQWRPLYATPTAQPVLAPVVREPLTEAQALAANPYINDPVRQALWLAAIRFAERFHGIQATTGEPS